MLNFISSVHKSTKRDYLARVNDTEYPKAQAAKIAKKFDKEYFDGSRKINYGGYTYQQGRWTEVIKNIIKYYKLSNNCKILDVGCAKGFFLADFVKELPKSNAFGVDISKYALDTAYNAIKPHLSLCNATYLPFPNKAFDFALSINTLHNLMFFDVIKALKELKRVSKKQYIVVESWRTEEERINLLYWQVTCQCIMSIPEWEYLFKLAGYDGGYEFIFFE